MEKNLNYNYGYDPDLTYRNLCQVMNCGMFSKGHGWYRSIACEGAALVWDSAFSQREIFMWIESELRRDLLGEENEGPLTTPIAGTINSHN